MGNHSGVTEFLILGFSEFHELKLPLFTLFLLIYLMAVLGNLLIICIVCADRHLHTPMYFFLANLSLIDVCSLTVTAPKLLAVLLTQNNAISFSDCILQMYFYMICTGTEFILLAVMAYDRYVAICNPLRYTIIMTRRICVLLAAFSWATGFIETLPQVIIISRFSFCSSNEIVHFFCDFTALMKLSCSETSTVELLNYIIGVFTDLTPFVFILTSYVCIILSIMKSIHSAEGRRKAFSTCSSHLLVVMLFYGTLMCVYLQPSSDYNMDNNMLVTVIFTFLMPLVNPLIYSIRNKDLKVALQKSLGRELSLSVNKSKDKILLVAQDNMNPRNEMI
ncbi:olfactory receptor 8D4-like [Rhinatrema bivittatum]|uniref:olfactory receptor 8D4-like n=1 Tax=Rhinatrema bivittatum TaxID=194408 RepID=UPI001127A71A|nr:olfactory receptor 8D4-like [Rhinatrema bivittatum]